MAKLFNRAKMTTTTTGSGTITLGSASNGFQSFADAGVANGDVVQYVIEEGANFEIGTGTYSSSGTSLTRSPSESSNSDNAITLAGQATVSITATHADFNRLQHGGSDKVTVSSTGASVTGNLAVSGNVDGVDVSAFKSSYDSHNHDDRYYTETEADSRFLRSDANDTYTGTLTFGNGTSAIYGSDNLPLVQVNSSRAYLGSTGRSKTVLASSSNTGAKSVVSGTEYSIFHDNYHPNADKWTTSRTLSLTGGVTGSVSWDGSANASLTSTVALATASAVGGIKIGYSENGKNYPVELDSGGKAYVNVPWTDTDTTHFNSLTGKGAGTGEYSTSGALTSGRGSGGVSLTINDGYGNANVTWNHKNGTPEQNGQSARIEVNTDSTTGEGTMSFEVSSAAVTSGTAVNLPVGMTLAHDYVEIPNQIRHAGDTDTYMQFHGANSWRVVTGGTERLEATNSGIRIDDAFTLPTTDGSANQVLVTNGSGTVSWATQTDTNTNQLTTFQLEDGDGTEVTVGHGKEVKFVENGGININWTDTSTGSDGDPYDLSFNVTSAPFLTEDSTVNYGTGGLQWTDQSGNGGSNGNGNAPSNPTNDWYHHIIANHANGTGYYADIAQSFHSDAVYHRRLTSGSLGSWQRFFTDAYHPNADKWTTARTHTVTLTGDVTGTASNTVDGSGNKTWTINASVGDAETVDGFNADRFMRRIAKANATVGGGWMTVATNTSGRKHGEVVVTDADSGDHAFIRIDWMRSYADSNFTVINCGGHANRITGARVLYETADNTYGTKLLQVYVTTSSNYEVNIYEHGDIGDYGSHSVVTPVIENSKTGYAVHGNQIEYLDVYGFAVEEGMRTGGHALIGGNLYIPDQIIHTGDTDTYMQFNAADTWRVVTAGAEAFKVTSDEIIASQEVRIENGNSTTTHFAYNNESGSENYIRGTRLHMDTAETSVANGLRVGSNGTNHNADGLEVNAGTDEKIVLSGTSNPYIRWQEGTTDKAYIQWQTNGHLLFRNQETGNFVFRPNSSTAAVYLRFEASDGDVYGGVYANHSNEVGFLDDDSHWAYKIATDSNHEWRINNSVQMSLSTSTLDMKGNTITEVEDIGLRDRIFHDGDTNTYMQFHNADQWRVVVGGTERLEVKNSSPHVLVTGDLNSTSDARLKENVEPIANALSDITQLEGVSFDWKDTGTRGHGFIAQQVEPILPDVVQTDDETGIKSINYVGMIGHLVEAIKEQQTQIDALTAQVEELKR